MRKNLLIVTATYFPDLGGAGIVAKNTSEELLENGYKVVVFCGGKIDKTEEINGVKVIRNNTLKNNSPYILSNYFNLQLEDKFLKIIKENNIDIVHFHSIQGLGANLLQLSLDQGIKTILTMHDFWWECPMLFLNDEYLSSRPVKNHSLFCNHTIDQNFLKKRQGYLYRILKNPKLTITIVSKIMKQTFKYIELPQASNYICIENGIIPQHPQKKILDKKETSKIIFAYFGGENLSKGFDLIINASKYLKYNFNNFEIHLFGIYRPKIKSIINYNFLRKYNIKLNGIYENKNLPKIFKNVDIVLIPSRVFESFSLIAREALLNNKIIISSRMGGLSELSSPRHIVFNKTSSADLAQKMFFAIKNIKNLQKKPLNIKTISLEKQCQLYQQIYNEK